TLKRGKEISWKKERKRRKQEKGKGKREDLRYEIRICNFDKRRKNLTMLSPERPTIENLSRIISDA
ncbi:MAG: hypothetical protein KAU91_01655, partial [Candidatus Aminicenantes bacterium]|nr:hypothetical protein [Candidatus Aminicenantes bacterium]